MGRRDLAERDDHAGNGHGYSRDNEPQPAWVRDSGDGHWGLLS